MNNRYRVLIIIVCIVFLWKFVEYIGSKHDENQVKSGASEGESSLLEKIKITVYYEALCSDSKNFILKQLQPTYDQIKNNILLEFVPYGKAETFEKDGEITFQCQHGSMECIANKVHACVINTVKDQQNQLKYIACMINDNMMPHHAGKQCGEYLGVSYEEISSCANGLKGSELLREYGVKTHSVSPEISFIPTIQINDSMKISQSKLLKNLKKEICELFEKPPKECSM